MPSHTPRLGKPSKSIALGIAVMDIFWRYKIHKKKTIYGLIFLGVLFSFDCWARSVDHGECLFGITAWDHCSLSDVSKDFDCDIPDDDPIYWDLVLEYFDQTEEEFFDNEGGSHSFKHRPTGKIYSYISHSAGDNESGIFVDTTGQVVAEVGDGSIEHCTIPTEASKHYVEIDSCLFEDSRYKLHDSPVFDFAILDNPIHWNLVAESIYYGVEYDISNPVEIRKMMKDFFNPRGANGVNYSFKHRPTGKIYDHIFTEHNGWTRFSGRGIIVDAETAQVVARSDGSWFWGCMVSK